jgi:flavin-dependent dehydrogenase
VEDNRTPPTRKARLVRNDAWVEAEFEGGRAGYCPRRFNLDGLLQDAAAEAGAELTDRTRVVEVILAFGRRARTFRRARREREDLLARARESEQG